jgi:hypothetical protein
VNKQLVDKMAESVDDITAAEIAPIPMRAIGSGQRYSITSGKAYL